MNTSSNLPLISVVIPTYNQSKLLQKSIKSAQRQTHSNIEIIVIDDHSTDMTSSIVHQMASKDPRIKYLTTKKQSNLPAVPRNIGINVALGEYVAFLDHDDLWRRKKLLIQISEMTKDTNIAMVFSPLWQFSGMNLLWGFALLRPPVENFSESSLNQGNPIQCSSVLAKRDVLLELGGFNENSKLRAVEDYDLWLRISKLYDIKQIYQVLGYYRHIASSTSQNENMYQRLVNLRNLHPSLEINDPLTFLQRILARLRMAPQIIIKLRI